MAKSMKGVEVDMSALAARNPNAIALGNGRMNARGDFINSRGEIIKPESAKYNKSNPKAVKQGSVTQQKSIKEFGEDYFMTPQQVVKKVTEYQKAAVEKAEKEVAVDVEAETETKEEKATKKSRRLIEE